MKKILIDGMTDNLGGMETFIRLIYEALKTEWKIDFITVNAKIPYEEEFLDNGSVIHRITPRYASISKYKKDIHKVFAENKYDVLWFNKTTLSSIDCLKEAKKNGVKKVICHSHQSKNMGTWFTQGMHILHRSVVGKYVDCKVACSVNAAVYFFGKNIKDVKIFSNAVDINKYEPNEEVRNQKRKELGIENQFVMANVARFAPEKNHKFLIEIFEEICKTEDAILLLCGEGSLLNNIKEYAAEKHVDNKIKFLGVRNDIPEILQATDVIIFPSLFEGLPFALVEAQAAGIPCVISDTISKDTELTDLVHFMSLEDSVEKWKDEIVKYQQYNKVSKRAQLEARGFSAELVMQEIRDIVKWE